MCGYRGKPNTLDHLITRFVILSWTLEIKYEENSRLHAKSDATQLESIQGAIGYATLNRIVSPTGRDDSHDYC